MSSFAGSPQTGCINHRCVSRSRFWGTPLPIWVSEDGEERVVVSSIAQLEELTGEKVNNALHAVCLLSTISALKQGNSKEHWHAGLHAGHLLFFWLWVT